MPIYFKELIFILAISIPLFAVAKRTALLFTHEEDFSRRRNIWLLLTSVAFLSPSFWLFAAIAVPTLYWGGRKDTNPMGFYLLVLTVIPSIPFELPTIGVQELFPLDIFRLLSLCILVPAALRIRKSNDPEQMKRGQVMDVALLCLGALQVVLFVPPDLPDHVILQNSITNDLRSAFLFLIDVYVLYYVASRSCSNQRKLRDALAAYCLCCSLMAAVAILESTKHWLLYTSINSRWGAIAMLSQYYVRGDLLRTQASSGQPLALGFLLAIALGSWLYLQSHVKARLVRIGVTTLLCGGLLVSFSRGPWFAALLSYFAYAGLSPRGASRLFKAATVILLLGAALLASPLGQKLSEMTPFLGGHVGESSLTYRERLFDRSWELLKEQPLFGDQLAYSKMQDLRQGQGIIDVVDAYVGIALFYGFTGLSFFLIFILSALVKAYRVCRRMAKTDVDSALLGANLCASILAFLLLLADGSLGGGPEHIFYALIGLTAAYVAINAPKSALTSPSDPLLDATTDRAIQSRAL